MIELHRGDCLEVMQGIPDTSVDLVLTDLPYQVTACRWDIRVPLEPLWAHYRRLLKPRGAVVLTASQPFTSMLVMSNREWFKYCLVWEKEVGTNFLNAAYQPFKVHEDIVVFSPAASSYSRAGTMTYHPQMVPRRPMSGGKKTSQGAYRFHVHPEGIPQRKDIETCHPRSVLFCPREMGSHATQKPVALMEYLIKTYTNEGETVLDSCMGSGTTGVACLNTRRAFIGIEKDPEIFATAEKRIATELDKTPLLTGS
jgi:site-specific DNA-methyltransferase (adenine-specific)